MSQPEVTVVVSPRERFSFSEQSLESIYSDLSTPFELVYVDGGSPPHIRRAIERLHREHGFTLIRTDAVLTPNEARNLAIEEVDTPWVMFVDNDVLIEPGWLGRLVEAGKANDAQLVGPLYMQDAGKGPEVHMAGGKAAFHEENGKRIFKEAHSHFGATLEDARKIVHSGPVELLEFHGMMASKAALDEHGPLDESLRTTMEHIDLCLDVRERGGTVWLAMDTTITYVVPPPFEPTDLGYFVLRWCTDWNRSTLDRFAQKWKLDPDDPYIPMEMQWAESHRELVLNELAWPLGKIGARLKYHEAKPIGKRIVDWLEDRYAAPLLAERRAAGLS